MDDGAGSVLKSPGFLAVTIFGILAIIAAKLWFDLSVQIMVLGIFVSALAGLIVGFQVRQAGGEKHLERLAKRLQIPIALAPEHDLFEQYGGIADSFQRLASQPHPVLRDFAHYTIAQFVQSIERISQGTLVFEGTESWRAAYKELLNAPHVKSYRSVAFIRQPDYWSDDAGESSLLDNFRLIHKGKSVERIAILGDSVWPAGTPLMDHSIGKWLRRQADGSIRVFIVRDSALQSDPDLRMDFGIYGDDAIGVQELDENAKTKKFTFYFDETARRLAEQRWKRLLAYSRQLDEFI